MADFWSAWDSSGRYRTRLRVWEDGSGGGQAKGYWDLTLFGSSNWTFYDWNTYGRVWIDGGLHAYWDNQKKPSSAWSASGGVVLASGSWGPTSGNRTIYVRSYFDARSTPDSYGPYQIQDTGDVGFAIGGGSAATVPGTMSAPTVSGVDHDSALISWTYPPNGGSALDDIDLHVNRTNNPTDPNGAAWYNWVGVVTSKQLENLPRNTQYYAFVRASNGVGEGGWSSGTAFKTSQYAPPSTPTGYGVTAVTSETCYTTAPTVSDNGGMALSNLQIQVNTTQSATGAETHTAGAYENIFIKDLVPGTQYYYRMRVYNAAPGGGWSEWGDWVGFTTLSNTPSAPTDIVTGFISGSGVVVSWDPPEYMRGSTLAVYQLRIATDDRFGNGLRSFAPGPDGSPFPISQLSPGTTYYVQLWAITDNGPGAYSTPVLFTTLADATSGLYLDFGTGPQFCEVWYNDEGVWKLCEPWQNVGTVSDDWKVGVQ